MGQTSSKDKSSTLQASSEIQSKSSVTTNDREIISGTYSDYNTNQILTDQNRENVLPNIIDASSSITSSSSSSILNSDSNSSDDDDKFIGNKIQYFLQNSWTSIKNYCEENPIVLISVSIGVFLIIICLIITCCFCCKKKRINQNNRDEVYDKPEEIESYAKDETIPYGANKNIKNKKSTQQLNSPNHENHVYQNVRPRTPERIETQVPLLGLTSNDSSPQSQSRTQTLQNTVNMVEDISGEEENAPKPKPRSKGMINLMKRNTIR